MRRERARSISIMETMSRHSHLAPLTILFAKELSAWDTYKN